MLNLWFMMLCVLSQGFSLSNSIATVSILHPSPLQEIHSTNITFTVEVKVNRGNWRNMHICVVIRPFETSEMGRIFPHRFNDTNRLNDICVVENVFSVGGYQPGTHLITMYLRGTIDNEDYVLAVTHAVFEMVSLPDQQSSHHLSPFINMSSIKYDQLDTLTTYESGASRDQTINTSITTSPLTKVIGMPTHGLRSASWLHPVRIVIYMKELQRHGANNRLLHWLLDHSTFVAHNYRLTVITGSDNSSHDMALYHQLTHIAQVQVLQFDCLSPTDNVHSTVNEEEHIITPSLQSLSAYLRSQEVDVIIAVNTQGDILTDRVLICADRDLKNGIMSGSINPVMRISQRRPLILMDLPNRKLHELWRDMIDVFIAPSRYVGGHRDIVELGKTTAVIYPPAVSLDWLTASPCSALHIMKSTVVDAQPGDEYRHIDVNPSSYMNDVDRHHQQKHTSPVNYDTGDSFSEQFLSNSDNSYKFIFMGRLAQEKCPGLLLHAIAFIHKVYLTHSTALFDLTSAESSDFITRAKFHIYGDGPLKNGLIDLASRLNISEMVHFYGALNTSQVMHTMRQSNVLINPILVGETFGFTHLEAGVMGIPVVAFHTGANAETISSGVLIYPKEGRVIEQLAEAIVFVFKHRYESVFGRREVCDRAKSRVTQWNVQRHSHSLMDVVATALRMRE